MAIAYDPDAFFDYVLKDDLELPKEEQTIWKLKTLSAREQQAIEDAWRTHFKGADNKREFDSVAVNRGTMTIETLRRGLCGWDNFCDSRGKPIAFIPSAKGGVCDMKNIDRIKPDDRHELSIAIETSGHMTEDEEKN